MKKVGLDRGDLRAARLAQLERAAGILEDELGLVGVGDAATNTVIADASALHDPTEVQLKELARWVEKATAEREDLDHQLADLGFRMFSSLTVIP